MNPANTPRHRPLRRLDNAALAAGVAHVCEREPAFRTQVERLGPPPMWARRPGFAALVRIILEQQVALASADALRARLIRELGALEPRCIAQAGEEGLRALGMTRQKASYCVGLAEQVLDGRFSFAEVARADDATARAMLVSVRGIGPWSADIYLLMALRRPDVWPTGDLALLVALQQLRGLGSKPDTARAEALTAPWAPFRSVGARLLWQAYLNRKLLQGTST